MTLPRGLSEGLPVGVMLVGGSGEEAKTEGVKSAG